MSNNKVPFGKQPPSGATEIPKSGLKPPQAAPEGQDLGQVIPACGRGYVIGGVDGFSRAKDHSKDVEA